MTEPARPGSQAPPGRGERLLADDQLPATVQEVVASGCVARRGWLRRQERRFGCEVKRWLVRIMIQAGTRRLLFSARRRRSFLPRGFLLAMVIPTEGSG